MTAHRKKQAAMTTSKGRRAHGAASKQKPDTDPPTKLDLLVSMLVRPDGASLAELTAATGWQAHSVRGALAGSLKKKGHVIVSEKIDAQRRYRIGAAR